MSENSGCFVRQTLLSCFFIMIAVVICSVGSIVGIDVLCHNNIEETLPFYPGAEIVSDHGGFFRVRGMGVSEVILVSADPAQTVRQWYRDQRLMREEQAYDEDTGRRKTPQNLATVDAQVTEAPETGQTLITLSSECAFN